MSDDWDEVSFVISSRYRVTVIKRLAAGPSTPSQIASDADVGIAHVSRALQRLRERSLVDLLVSEAICDGVDGPVASRLTTVTRYRELMTKLTSSQSSLIVVVVRTGQWPVSGR